LICNLSASAGALPSCPPPPAAAFPPPPLWTERASLLLPAHATQRDMPHTQIKVTATRMKARTLFSSTIEKRGTCDCFCQHTPHSESKVKSIQKRSNPYVPGLESDGCRKEVVDILLYFMREFTAPSNEVAPFSLQMWGAVFHCLQKPLFLSFSSTMYENGLFAGISQHKRRHRLDIIC
jgi:hypothetical protein